VLDSEGVAKLATLDQKARAYFLAHRAQRGRVVVSAATLGEVLHGHAASDANINRVLGACDIVPLDEPLARRAAKLLRETGLGKGEDAHRCTVDAFVAATALAQPRPVLLLTSDLNDMTRLTEEPDQPKELRVVVQLV
jgi:predicted nucleic acid-binding protein